MVRTVINFAPQLPWSEETNEGAQKVRQSLQALDEPYVHRVEGRPDFREKRRSKTYPAGDRLGGLGGSRINGGIKRDINLHSGWT
jgi:hypothetical protein